MRHEDVFPEQLLWAGVIERAVLDARGGNRHAHDARAWLLESPQFLRVAYLAGSTDADALRSLIGGRLDPRANPPQQPRETRLPSVTLLTAPVGMPLWEIAEKISRGRGNAVRS